MDALQYDWNGENEVHLATRLARKGCEGRRSHELTPGLHVCQERRDRPTDVLMASAANMFVRKSMFQELGGFDEMLFFGYEDVELCWRGWIHGWKTVFAPEAKCWHRVGHSSHSDFARSLAFRGVSSGRLIMATKLLPLGYVLRAWLVCLAALARDVAFLRWQATRDRIKVIRDCVRNLPVLMRERRELFHSQPRSSQDTLDRLLQMAH